MWTSPAALFLVSARGELVLQHLGVIFACLHQIHDKTIALHIPCLLGRPWPASNSQDGDIFRVTVYGDKLVHGRGP